MNERILKVARDFFAEMRRRRMETKQEVPFMMVLFWPGKTPHVERVPPHLNPDQRAHYVRMMAAVTGAEYVMTISEAWVAVMAPPEGTKWSLEEIQAERAKMPKDMKDWDEREEVLMGWLDGNNEAITFKSVITGNDLSPTTEMHVTKGEETTLAGRLTWMAPTNA